MVLLHLARERGHLHRGPGLSEGLRRYISCDSRIRPVFESEGKPVSVGRAFRKVPDRTRIVIEERDRGCRAPGCDRRRWLQVHHIAHWEDGGATDTSNLIALCQMHHRLHHRGRLGIEGNGDDPQGVVTDERGRRRESCGRPVPPGDERPPPGNWVPPSGERPEPWPIYSTSRSPSARRSRPTLGQCLMLIHVVADYGHGDLAFAEVIQRLALHLPGATIVPTPVPVFDTISAGFCVAQLALTPGPPRVVFHNVAPRGDTPDPRPGNQGERLVCATLPGDVLVVGPNAGHAFSFVRDEALTVREVPYGAAGSQFRSRDFFPELVSRIVRGDELCLGDELPADAVGDPPERQVVYVDGYGNLKTSWFDAPVESGEQVAVTIGDTTAPATVSDGTFEVPAGDLSFAPGSSGWTSRSGREVRFFELFLRGGSAARRFGAPPAGADVDVRPEPPPQVR